MKERILKIHASPYKIVIAITGGGTEVIGELLRYGEGSNTLLEAIVPYANSSLEDFLSTTLDKCCSAQVAEQMAQEAYRRAMFLALATHENYLIGVGVTCSLAKRGPEREGRRHVAYVCVKKHDGVSAYVIEPKGGSRETEETYVANLVEIALSVACETEVALGGFAQLAYCHTQVLLNDIPQKDKKVIFPGSFNPIHHCHLAMARAAFQITGCTVDLELSVKNFDKPALDIVDVNARLTNIKEETKGIDHIGRLHITNAPTFVEKSELFGPATFVIGSDTLLRIASHGNLEETAAKLKANGAKFLVCLRGNGDTVIPASLAELCEIVPPQLYKDDGTSSTKLRAEKA